MNKYNEILKPLKEPLLCKREILYIFKFIAIIVNKNLLINIFIT